ncbi:hypothetical protein FXO38_04300 [Capsicum annuum]|nr:hypothetical protein FXO38_04300 [Capsicum annuum]KAF3678905.1 hypothetical protein FXO37_04140 [Capsicum annuum]
MKQERKIGKPMGDVAVKVEKQADPNHGEQAEATSKKVSHKGQHQVMKGGAFSFGWVTPSKTGRNQSPQQTQVASNNSFQILNKPTEVQKLDRLWVAKPFPLREWLVSYAGM